MRLPDGACGKASAAVMCEDFYKSDRLFVCDYICLCAKSRTVFSTVDYLFLRQLYNNFLSFRQAIAEPRYGLGFCLLPSALHSFLKYSKYSCKFVASPNEKMQKHKLCDLPFRKITDISKSQNAVILTYYKR